MEQNRTHVLDWTTWFKNIPFTDPPVNYFDFKTIQTTPVVPNGEQFTRKTAKLDPQAVRAIRTALAHKDSIIQIAARHKVTTKTIIKIRDGHSWADVK